MTDSATHFATAEHLLNEAFDDKQRGFIEDAQALATIGLGYATLAHAAAVREAAEQAALKPAVIVR